MARDDWPKGSEDQRSSFSRVLESLDAVIHRHPAGGAQRDGQPIEQPSGVALPDNVVDLRARLATVRSGGVPDDAA